MPVDFPDRIRQLTPFRTLLIPIDMAAVAGTGALAAVVAQTVRPDLPDLWPVPGMYQLPILVGALLAPTMLTWFGVYRSWRGLSLESELRPVVFGTLATFLVLALLGLV